MSNAGSSHRSTGELRSWEDQDPCEPSILFLTSASQIFLNMHKMCSPVILPCSQQLPSNCGSWTSICIAKIVLLILCKNCTSFTVFWKDQLPMCLHREQGPVFACMLRWAAEKQEEVTQKWRGLSNGSDPHYTRPPGAQRAILLLLSQPTHLALPLMKMRC